MLWAPFPFKEGAGMRELVEHTEGINRLMARFGVKFGIYKNGEFHEQLFPFDAIPRVITREEFRILEKGLIQRADALNLFLKDIYGEKKIIKDQVVPEEFVFISSGYLPECEGICPPKGIHSHISGIDLVLGKDGEWYILEDNLRIPSGASYPMIAREICRRVSPKTFSNNQIVDNRNYADLLKETLDWVNTGGIPVIMTPGRYNAAYFEHSYLAERTGSGSGLRVNGELPYGVTVNERRPVESSASGEVASAETEKGSLWFVQNFNSGSATMDFAERYRDIETGEIIEGKKELTGYQCLILEQA